MSVDVNKSVVKSEVGTQRTLLASRFPKQGRKAARIYIPVIPPFEGSNAADTPLSERVVASFHQGNISHIGLPVRRDHGDEEFSPSA